MPNTLSWCLVIKDWGTIGFAIMRKFLICKKHLWTIHLESGADTILILKSINERRDSMKMELNFTFANTILDYNWKYFNHIF